MTIYKVRITTDGDKTRYTTNGYLLAETAKAEAGYTMTSDGDTQTFATLSEAETAAEAAATKILASVGCTPKFIVSDQSEAPCTK